MNFLFYMTLILPINMPGYLTSAVYFYLTLVGILGAICAAFNLSNSVDEIFARGALYRKISVILWVIFEGVVLGAILPIIAVVNIAFIICDKF